MRTLRTLAVWIAAGLLVPAATSQAAETIWRTRVELKMIAVKQPAGKPLLLRLMAPATTSAALKELDDLVAKEQAELIDYQFVVIDAKTGVRSPGPHPDVLASPVTAAGPPPPDATANAWRGGSETTMEWRYPSAFEPPQEPQTFGVSQPNPEPWRTDNQFAFTSFETRNLLGSLDAEAFVRPGGRVIDLNLAATYVEFERFDFYPGAINPWGTAAGNVQPLFRDSHTQTQLHVSSGQPLLLASFIQQEPEPRIVFFILKATATQP
jgi:hypothetical protein